VRISVRLRQANCVTFETASAELGTSFMPVLARQEDAVEQAVTELFGALTHTKVSACDAAGWAAGTAAADLADLLVHQRLPGSSPG